MGEVVDYVRERAFNLLKDKSFAPYKFYNEPSISFITLFLEEHPDFCSKLASEKDKAIDELFKAVPDWIDSRSRRIVSVSEDIKKLCAGKLNYFARIRLYNKLSSGSGLDVHGTQYGFMIGHSNESIGFSLFLDESSLRMPLTNPAFSYERSGEIYLRRNSCVYDTAVKLHALKNPVKYGLKLQPKLRESFLESIRDGNNLKVWLLHEHGEVQKSKCLQEEFGVERADQAICELVSDYFAVRNSTPAVEQAMLLDMLIRKHSTAAISADALQSEDPAEAFKRIINGLLDGKSLEEQSRISRKKRQKFLYSYA